MPKPLAPPGAVHKCRVSPSGGKPKSSGPTALKAGSLKAGHLIKLKRKAAAKTSKPKPLPAGKVRALKTPPAKSKAKSGKHPCS